VGLLKISRRTLRSRTRPVKRPEEAPTPDNDTAFPGKSTKDKERTKAAKEYAAALREARDAEEEVQITQDANARRNKEDLDQQTIDYAKYVENAKKYNQALYDAETDRTKAEYIAALAAAR
jgi:hypothetical protein